MASPRPAQPPLRRLHSTGCGFAGAASGDREQAAAVLDRLQTLARMNAAVPSLRAAVKVCRGLLADDPEALAAGARLYGEARRPLEAGTAALEAAVLLGCRGRHQEAHRLAVDGMTHLERIGANYDTAKWESRLRACGVRLGRRGPRRRPQTGWDSLTPTEHRVLDLVVAGHSNPEIADRLLISRNTVRAHVSSLLAKLGVASRVELAVAAARRDERR